MYKRNPEQRAGLTFPLSHFLRKRPGSERDEPAPRKRLRKRKKNRVARCVSNDFKMR